MRSKLILQYICLNIIGISFANNINVNINNVGKPTWKEKVSPLMTGKPQGGYDSGEERTIDGIQGVSSTEMDLEKRVVELKNAGQSSDYYMQNYYICQSDKDCIFFFKKPLSKCNKDYCLSQHSDISCKKDYECPINNFCEEDTCRQIYCKEDYDCPSHDMKNLRVNEIENFIVQCDIYNKICTRKLKVRCAGEDDDCCTPSHPCDVGDGDCDLNEDCMEGLTCGTDNCPQFGGLWEANDDCCQKSDVRCAGEDDDCCTPSHPCNVGDGDCDVNEDCMEGLTCGTDNCQQFGGLWEANDDCCQKSDGRTY